LKSGQELYPPQSESVSDSLFFFFFQIV